MIHGHEPRETSSISIEETEMTKDFILGFISDVSQRDVASKASLLVVPTMGFRDHEGPIFPVGTEEFFSHLQNRCKKDNIPLDIAIDEDSFTELALCADLITIATLFVQYALVPIAVNMVYDFIKLKLGQRFSRTDAKFELITQTEGKTISIKYDGPAENLEKTINAALSGIGEND